MIPRTSAERLWVGAGGFLALVALLIGYFFLIGPQREETDTVQSQFDDAQLQNMTLQSRINHLAAEKSKAKTFAAGLQAARQALPSREEMAAFLRTVQSLGASTNTSVTSVTVGEAAPVVPVAPVAAPAESGSAEAPKAPAVAPGAPPPASVYTIPITASVTGSTAGLNKFLDKLQNDQPRAVLISSVTRSAADASGAGRAESTASLQITMSAFVAPGAQPASPTPPPSGA